VAETLLSVGLDVGTTTTQMIVSRLTVENKASGFCVPEMEIAQRQVVYRSHVHFTPLLGQSLVDGEGVRAIVEEEYKKAGITPDEVDTGAVIITGETSRKENARAVLDSLAALAGDFVVATAGPDLESVLAAKGAGAVEYSHNTGKTVLHMDIGGGTSNLALISDGRILQTGCMNVGGRLLKFDADGKLSYVSPALQGLTHLQPGDYPNKSQVEDIAKTLAMGLEMAAGLRPSTDLLPKLWTKETPFRWTPPEKCVISFSGGVADCIKETFEPRKFGDMGPELAAAIQKSLLCRGEYVLGEQTIRATVIGAGCHSAQLSGSTVFCQGVDLPVKNLPVAVFTRQEQESGSLADLIRQRLSVLDTRDAVIALPGASCSYAAMQDLAQKLLDGVQDRAVYVCLEADMAKALGQKLCLLMEKDRPCLCIDRVRLTEGSFLDVGCPVGPALPVVVKTLVLEQT